MTVGNILRNAAHAHCMLGNYGYRHTLIICNTCCFSTATVGTGTRIDITLVPILPVLLNVVVVKAETTYFPTKNVLGKCPYRNLRC